MKYKAKFMKAIYDFFIEDFPNWSGREVYGEWSGPCPWCGGIDRFHLGGGQEHHLWGCRACNKKGDTITYLREVRGLSFTEAKALAYGVEPSASYSSEPPQQKTYSRQREPSAQWVTAATRFLQKAQKDVELPEGIAILGQRHLTLETAKAVGIGFQRQYRKDDPLLRKQDWGIETEPGKSDTVFIPRGLVLPIFRQSGLKKLAVRCYPPVFNGQRYLVVQGSGGGYSYVLGTSTDCVILFEGVLDAILCWQTTRLLNIDITVVAGGSATADIDAETMDYIKSCKYIFGSFDADSAGQAGWHKWQGLFPGITPAPAFGAKDIGDMQSLFAEGKCKYSVEDWFIGRVLAPIKRATSVRIVQEAPIAADEAPQENSQRLPIQEPAAMKPPTPPSTPTSDRIVAIQEALVGEIESIKQAPLYDDDIPPQDDRPCHSCGAWEPLYLDFNMPSFWDKKRSRLGTCHLYDRLREGDLPCFKKQLSMVLSDDRDIPHLSIA